MPSWTLKSLIDERITVTAFCHAPLCHHHQVLNLDLLMDHYGPDFPAMHDDLAPRLRCTKCKGKKVGLTYTPDVDGMNADRMAGRNLYAKSKGG